MSTTEELAVELHGVTKHFGGVAALRNGQLAVRAGTIHALVGENGAGKSTLAKIIAGVHRPDGGILRVGGEERHYHSPRHAIADGITIMSQELSLLPARTVIENVFLGSEPSNFGFVRRRQLRRAYRELSERVGLNVDPDRRVRDLRLADQQRVEMLRAFARNVRVIILDEPTATLSTQDAAQLLITLQRFRDAGLTIIYISHFLEEVLETADEVTVLRDGAFVLTGESSAHSPATLVTAMAGRPLDVTFPLKTPPANDAAEVLRVSGLRARNGTVQDVAFSVREGEIVCLGGLVGSGRSEVAQCIYGALRHDGEIRIQGRRVRWTHPRTAISNGVTLIPESRKAQGILPNGTVKENLSIAFLSRIGRFGWVSRRKEARLAGTEITQLDIRPVDQHKRAVDLSGGNQQKILFGRALMPSPKLLIIDEPTRGVDVAAKRAIYELITRLARAGLAILMISSETDEVLGLAHRIVVMRDGRTVGELDGFTATKEQFVASAFTPPMRREQS